MLKIGKFESYAFFYSALRFPTGIILMPSCHTISWCQNKILWGGITILVTLLVACKPGYETDKNRMERILDTELPVSSYYFYSSCEFANGFLDQARGDTINTIFEYFKFEATDEQKGTLVDAFGLSVNNPHILTNYNYLMGISTCKPKWWEINEPFELFELPSYQYDEFGIPIEFNNDDMYLLYKNGEIYIYRVTE